MIESREPANEAIASLAYGLYLERGSEPGKDVEDWFKAERRLSDNAVAEPIKGKSVQADRN